MGFLSDDDSAAQGYLQNAINAYQNLATPAIASEEITNLPQQTVQGTINPNQITAVNQAPSAYNNISLDPATRQAQINALNSYQNIANQGGLDANAKLAIQQTIDAANTQSQGAQGAIQNQAQAMGQGGGDFALTQRALAAQGASNNAATQGLETAAMAETNRENALNQMANIGSNVNAADFGQAATAATAQNAINATNQGYQNQANVGNVANNMTAQTTNLQNKQNVNAANTGALQNSAYYNAQLPQQQFNNELSKVNGIAGLSAQQAGLSNQAAMNDTNATMQLWGSGVKAAGAAAASEGGMAHEDGTINCYAEGGVAHNHYMCMLMGGSVPGKAQVSGDSSKNDTVPAMLSPGEIVVKRSKAQNPEEAAKEAKKISLENFSKGYKRSK